MIFRLTRSRILEQLSEAPAALLIGARQVGKTTLARSLRGAYFDLEQRSDRLRLDLMWDSLCKGSELIVLDEAQAWPEVFNRLRGAIDADRSRYGRFLLLGSVAPMLMQNVSQSLAGRLRILHLSPLTCLEVKHHTLDTLWLKGGFPEPLQHPKHFPHWHKNYLTLLAQKDLPEWGLPSKPSQTEKLFKMLAIMNGQAMNASQLGNSLGISHNTVREYINFLKGAFLIRELPPYFSNIKKRLVKSPKVYWADTGLLHAIMGVEDYEQLLTQPWVGASWEGFVIEQIINSMAASNQMIEPFHLRTSDGHELDLLFKYAKQTWAIEIKLSSSPSINELQRLNKVADMIGADKRVLISRTTEVIDNGTSISCNLQNFLNDKLLL